MNERLRKAAALLRPQALVVSARAHARLPDLVRHIEALTNEVRALTATLETVSLHERQLRAVLQSDATGDERVLRFQSMLDEPSLAQHIEKAVSRATLHLDPFPYCVVDRLLPRSYYDALIAAIPPVELFGDRPVNKQQLLVPFVFAPKYSRVVWAHMADVAATRLLAPAIVSKFREPLADWLREHFPAVGADPLAGVELKCSDGRIMLRRPGYKIPPHRDPKWGFITCLLYLARPGDDSRWGTQLFRVEADDEARGGAPHWVPEERCRWVADVEFLPNRALIFLNSTGAHGAHIPDDAEPADLERYTYQFRVGPERESMEALRSTLPEERQPLWAGKVTSY
ncbi:MAG: hypothetical protein HYU37_06580 [Acidobacteria bacterium]|nr:hypothetical protein [Acidobacteriota bacterium]